MFRALLLLAVGGVAGATTAYLVLASSTTAPAPVQDPTARSSAAELPPPQPPVTTARNDGAQSVSGNDPHAGFASLRLSLFEQAAAITAFDELEHRIATVAVRPRSRAREAELNALLLRYAELDPARATAFAWSANLETRFVASLMRVWTSVDDSGAIAWLQSMSPNVEQRQFALAVLDVLGHDQRSVSRVAAALSPGDRFGLEVDVLLLRAESDPEGALRTLMSMGDSGRAMALTRIAPMIIRSDPRQALAAASTIDDESVRTVMVSSLLSAWAEADPETMFTLLEALSSDHDESDPALQHLRSGVSLLGLFQRVADGDHERLLRLADQLPSGLRTQAQRAALQAMATTNPQGAVARIDLLPLGQERNTLMNSIAAAWGRTDPGAALAWARSLSPASPQVLRGVVSGVAATNLDAAIDLIQAELGHGGAGAAGAGSGTADLTLALSIMSGLSMRLLGGSADHSEMARVVGRLLDTDHPTMQMVLSSVLGTWAGADAESALAWVVANESRLDASALSGMAQQAVRSNDPETAIAMMANLPPRARAGWMQGVAAGLASYSADQAVAFLDQYRGQPGYDVSISNVVSIVAQRDPVSAARMLSGQPPSPQLNQAAALVAGNWVRQDPRAAAQWATELGDEAAQRATFGSIASAWATSDADAARAWTTTLQAGGARDQAITGLLMASAARGEVDAALIGTFSSDLNRNDALNRIILQLSRTNPSQARSLLDTWVDDPQQRRQIEQNMARVAGPALVEGVRLSVP